VGQYCAFDETTGEIYVAGPTQENFQDYSIYSVNVQNMQIKRLINVGLYNIIFVPIVGIHGFDPKNNNILLQYTQGYILGYSVTSQKMVFNVTNDQAIFAMNYHHADGLFYGMGVGAASLTVASLNGANGQQSYVSTVPGYAQFEVGVSALDESTNTLYSILFPDGKTEFHLVGVHIYSGAVISTTPICSATQCPLSIQYF